MTMAPRGPLPARVYWIRRGIVIGVALLLVLVIAKLLGGGSDGSEKADASARLVGSQSTTGPSSAATGSATDGATEDATVLGGKGKRAPLAEPSGPCDPEKVTITGTSSKRPNDGKVEMPLVVTTSEEACTFTFSPESVAVKIVSGADNIWSSQRCHGLPTGDLVVRAAKPAHATFTWNGHRADDECTRAAPWAGIGSYHLIAATLGGEPTDTQFELTGPPEVVITKTAKPKPTPTPTGSATTKATATSTAKTDGGDPRQP